MSGNATVTMPLKEFEKLKKRLKKAERAKTRLEQRFTEATHAKLAARKHEEAVVATWDKHSHQICDALDTYYSDDGAGFDYDNMIHGINRLTEDMRRETTGRQNLQRRNEKFYELWQAAMKWAAQGPRSRWSTRASLELWDIVKELEEPDERT